MTRHLRFFEAIREAIDLCMARDASVFIMGLGVPDPKGIFGTTQGLLEQYGSQRVMDMPTSENGMTGVSIGAALVGMRPILVHQRLDFALLSMEQIVNQAAKWHYVFGGQTSVPLVIRLVVGRGWGQGPTHSQSLQSWFAHVPGLKVVMPATPHDAKGLLMASIADANPVIFIEHRWLHNTFGPVPVGDYDVPLGQARIARQGTDLTIVAVSYMVVEALRSAELLTEAGIDVEVIDVRTLRPLDTETVLDSVRKTGRVLVADTGWKTCGFSSEMLAVITEEAFGSLMCPPRRATVLDTPIPTSPALSRLCYPRATELAIMGCEMMGVSPQRLSRRHATAAVPCDVPDHTFSGPF